MAYVPDPNDPTEPTDGQPAGTAAAEFRALKAKLNTVAAAASSIKIQDDEPASVKGEQWFESDTGHMYLRYQNPDLTFAWIKVNGFVA